MILDALRGAVSGEFLANLFCIQVEELHTLALCLRYRVNRCCPLEARVIDIGDDEQARFARIVNGVVDRADSHRTDPGEDRHLTALHNAHVVLVLALGSMVAGVEGTHNAGHRFGKRPHEERFPLVGQQAVHLHHFVWNVDVGGIPSDVPVGVPRCRERPLIVERGLDGKSITAFELLLPLLSDLHDFPAELMPDDNRVRGNIRGDPFVVAPLHGRFVGRHAYTVRYDMGNYLVVPGRRELELFKPQVLLTIHSDRCSLH